MYHRSAYPPARTPSTQSLADLAPPPRRGASTPRASPRLTPLLPPPSPNLNVTPPPVYYPDAKLGGAGAGGGGGVGEKGIEGGKADKGPTVFGLQLKYVSLVTLAVQNAALSIVMHYSRVSTPSSQAYSPASAVLLNELLKGSISFYIALLRLSPFPPSLPSLLSLPPTSILQLLLSPLLPWSTPFRRLTADLFSKDAWKLSIPATLYVVQNSLQFVAIANLPVASFQVTYQMKILTTAAFSVALLRRRLTATKWVSLLFLAIGVGIVQLQTTFAATTPSSSSTARDYPVGSAHDEAPFHVHVMSPLKGFAAVTAACFTSGLAGVYFEMVLKNSKADLWVRNVQLSLFSLLPALLPVFWSPHHSHGYSAWGALTNMWANFGGWAWATVAIQTLGGLITAIVIKYSDNIMKGFATSLSIILSFLASVVLFRFEITGSFLVGSGTVLAATWMYNQPEGMEPVLITRVIPAGLRSGRGTPYPGTSPVSEEAPILGEFGRRGGSPGLGSGFRVAAPAPGAGRGAEGEGALGLKGNDGYFPEAITSKRANGSAFLDPADVTPFSGGSRSSSPGLGAGVGVGGGGR